MANDWTPAQLQAQLHTAKANGLASALIEGAKVHGLEPALVLAIASRETNITNEVGDAGHGYGPMQLDNRSHGIPANWKVHPSVIIDACCGILDGYISWAEKQYPHLDAVKIGCSAYNAGPGGAAYGVARGDSDLRTTGGDYGKDVLARRDVFAKLLA